MASVVTRSPNKPKYRRAVDKTKYDAMKKILVKFFPKREPGKTQREMHAHAKKKAKKTLFPGTTWQWWSKCVQLDLEAKGVLVREQCTPLRWHRRR